MINGHANNAVMYIISAARMGPHVGDVHSVIEVGMTRQEEMGDQVVMRRDQTGAVSGILIRLQLIAGRV